MALYYCTSCGHIINKFGSLKEYERCPYCKGFASVYYLSYVDTAFANNNGFMFAGTAHITKNCTEKRMEFPPNTTSLDKELSFRDNGYIEEIVFPKTINIIPEYYCANCSKLKKVLIPGNVRWIEKHAFDGCKELREIVLYEGVEHIEDRAFNNCENLERVSLPKSLVYIDDSAFRNCKKLKEVLIPDGVEEIGDWAFYECESLERVTLPKQLKKLGMYSFWGSGLKYFVLPKNIEEMGTLPLGNGYRELKVFVPNHSKTESSLQYQYHKHVFSDEKEPIALRDGMKGNDLICWVGDQESATIPYGVRSICSKAFEKEAIKSLTCPSSLVNIHKEAFKNCNFLEKVNLNQGLINIEEKAFVVEKGRGCIKTLDIPSTVKKIGKDAFKGHKIEKLIFHNGIEEIDSGAFSDCLEWEINLPRSIKTISSNAFPQNAYLSVDGMPLEIFLSSTDYFKKEKQLTERIDEIETLINNKKSKVSNNQWGITSLTNKIINRDKEIDEAAASIKKIEKQKEEIFLEAEGRIKEYNSYIVTVKEHISSAENEKDALNEDYNKTFFLALSRKKEIAEKISEKELEIDNYKTEVITLEENIKNENIRKQDVEHRLQSSISNYTRLLELNEDEKEQINKNTKEKERIEREIEGNNITLTELKSQLLELNEEFEKKNKSKKDRLEKKKLLAEKDSLIRGIPEPNCKFVKVPQYKEIGNEVIDQTLLREAFEIILKRKNAESLKELLPQLYKNNKKSVDRIKAINKKLTLESFDGIDLFASLEKGEEEYEVKLPERFMYLYDFFSENEEWRKLYTSKDNKKHDRGYIGSFFVEFFDGIDFIPLTNIIINNTVLAFMPYCILVLRNLTELSVLKYDDTSINYECTEKDYKRPPADREIVSQHYLHQNADGTPNKRYKDNYLIYSTRLNYITVASGKHSYKISIPTKSEAENFIYRFKEFKESLADGLRGKVYQAFLESKDLDEIKSIVSEEERVKKEREEQEKLRLEELARKEEEKRIAEEKEKEEKRKAIIERQRQLNEERKAQKEAQKEKITKIISMFEDDEDAFFGEKKENVAVAKEKSNGPLEVIGNKLISNNVFKIVFKQSTDLPEDTLTFYFTDTKGHVISNRKSYVVPDVGAETKVGFILKSGIDFTQMDSCTLVVEAEEDICQEIIFKMNISFYSDF